jgi:nucleoside-diphosphate-sugar epimerase
VIPTIIGQLLNGAAEISLGSLSPTRDLVYVKDTVRGFRSIAECDAAIGREINIATQTEVSIGDLAATLIRQINPSAAIRSSEERVRPKNSEVERLLGSNALLRELTGWKPEWPLENGLAETIEWFRQPANLARYKTHLYNV